MRKNGKSISTLALVDSGADTCVFPASLATQLGITIPNQNVSVFSGTSDAPQLAYYEMVEANIWNGDPKCPPMTFEMRVGFCETLEHVGLGLLGQEGFLSKFPVTFNYSANFFEIG